MSEATIVVVDRGGFIRVMQGSKTLQRIGNITRHSNPASALESKGEDFFVGFEDGRIDHYVYSSKTKNLVYTESIEAAEVPPDFDVTPSFFLPPWKPSAIVNISFDPTSR